VNAAGKRRNGGFMNREDEKFDKENIFGKGAPNTAFAQYFIGESFLNPLTDIANGEYPIFSVC
jgi:hypothetical protein